MKIKKYDTLLVLYEWDCVMHHTKALSGQSWLGTSLDHEGSILRVKNELKGPRVSSALSFIGGVHIGARALHILNLIWFA